MDIEPTHDCSELVEALEKLYAVTQKLAFYFVPKEILIEVMDTSKSVEQVIKKYKVY